MMSSPSVRLSKDGSGASCRECLHVVLERSNEPYSFRTRYRKYKRGKSGQLYLAHEERRSETKGQSSKLVNGFFPRVQVRFLLLAFLFACVCVCVMLMSLQFPYHFLFFVLSRAFSSPISTMSHGNTGPMRNGGEGLFIRITTCLLIHLSLANELKRLQICPAHREQRHWRTGYSATLVRHWHWSSKSPTYSSR